MDAWFVELQLDSSEHALTTLSAPQPEICAKGDSKPSANAYPLLGANRLGRACQRCPPDSEWSP